MRVFQGKSDFFQDFSVFLRSQYNIKDVFKTLEGSNKVENGSKQPKIGQISCFQAKMQNPIGLRGEDTRSFLPVKRFRPDSNEKIYFLNFFHV